MTQIVYTDSRPGQHKWSAIGLAIAVWYYWPRKERKRWYFAYVLVPLVVAVSLYEAVATTVALARGLR